MYMRARQSHTKGIEEAATAANSLHPTGGPFPAQPAVVPPADETVGGPPLDYSTAGPPPEQHG